MTKWHQVKPVQFQNSCHLHSLLNKIVLLPEKLCSFNALYLTFTTFSHLVLMMNDCTPIRRCEFHSVSHTLQSMRSFVFVRTNERTTEHNVQLDCVPPTTLNSCNERNTSTTLKSIAMMICRVRSMVWQLVLEWQELKMMSEQNW